MSIDLKMLRAWAWRGTAFIAIFAILQLGWQRVHGSWIENVIVHNATVVPAAMAINLLTPNVDAQPVRFSIRSPRGSLNILNGCEGIEALFLLVSASIAVPLGWQSRLQCIAIGTIVVFIANQTRIVTLFYAALNDRKLFDVLHGIVTPIALILVVGGYFYAWLSRAVQLPQAN